MRPEQEIFDELAKVCSSPGYIHAIAYLCFRDNMIPEHFKAIVRASGRIEKICAHGQDNSAPAPCPQFTPLQRLWRWEPDDTPTEKPDKMEETLQTTSLPLKEAMPLFSL